MAKLKSANFPLDKILGDRSGKELGVVLRALSNEFGTVKICNGIASEAGSILSALTKICSFLSPGDVCCVRQICPLRCEHAQWAFEAQALHILRSLQGSNEPDIGSPIGSACEGGLR
jgi:hypothetical protein